MINLTENNALRLDRDTACCFTGHRIIFGSDIEAVRRGLINAIDALYGAGIRCFISGGAIGFDIEAAEAVISARSGKPDIRLIMALPCEGQDRPWTAAQRERYCGVLDAADEIIYVSRTYSPYCMQKRNRFMVDNSRVVLAYIQRPYGGTAYTVSYALDSGLRVINVLDAAEQEETDEL